MFSINAFPTEQLFLHKFTGEIVENVTALVDEDEIHIDDVSIAIEEGDYFERKLPNGTYEYYRVIDRGFYKGDGITFPDHYQSKVTKVNKSEMKKGIQSKSITETEKKIEKPQKVFISHSSKERDYVLALVELLEDLGLPDGSIVCSSVPGYGIPGGEKTFDWLRKQFIDCDLRVIFALSKNYYVSAASLNEMGAAWITKASDTLILLPGFEFEDIKGCIDPTEIGIKLDGDAAELKHRLGELKDTLVLEHNLNSYSGTRWERHRDNFIKCVNELSAQNSETMSLDSEYSINTSQSMYGTIPDNIPVEPAFLLVYAAATNGQVIKIKSSLGNSIDN